jgi:hypothetical protein
VTIATRPVRSEAGIDTDTMIYSTDFSSTNRAKGD